VGDGDGADGDGVWVDWDGVRLCILVTDARDVYIYHGRWWKNKWYTWK